MKCQPDLTGIRNFFKTWLIHMNLYSVIHTKTYKEKQHRGSPLIVCAHQTRIQRIQQSQWHKKSMQIPNIIVTKANRTKMYRKKSYEFIQSYLFL